MATEEIEISDLELIEELSPDNVLPIETTTKTFATTLKKIRDWLGIESAILKQVPTGLILPYGGSTTPEGFLLCNGATINRTTYANLFNAIGTTYGAGDGSTTFNLPNYSSARMVTSSTISVKGTGKSLGLTDGTNNMGMQANGGYGIKNNKSLFNVNVGTKTGSASPDNSLALGITTDSSKSGIIGTASLANSCKFIIKY